MAQPRPSVLRAVAGVGPASRAGRWTSLRSARGAELAHAVAARAGAEADAPLPQAGDRVDRMQTHPRPKPRETTETMLRNIGHELAQIELAIGRCRGDRVAEPRLTGAWMAHLLISSRALLQNLLIDTARRPKRIETPSLSPSADRAPSAAP